MDIENFMHREKPYSECWAITARKHSRVDQPVSITDYDSLIDHLGEKLIHKCFERNPTNHNHYHLHGVVVVSSNYLRSKLRQKQYHIYLVRIFDMAGWLLYMSKDQDLRRDTQLSLFIQDKNDEFIGQENTQ